MDNNEEKNPLEPIQETGYIEQVEIDHEMRTAYIRMPGTVSNPSSDAFCSAWTTWA